MQPDLSMGSGGAAPRFPRAQAGGAHSDSKGVAVWDLIVDDGLDVDGLQLELDGNVDEPAGDNTQHSTSEQQAAPEQMRVLPPSTPFLSQCFSPTWSPTAI